MQSHVRQWGIPSRSSSSLTFLRLKAGFPPLLDSGHTQSVLTSGSEYILGRLGHTLNLRFRQFLYQIVVSHSYGI